MARKKKVDYKKKYSDVVDNFTDIILDNGYLVKEVPITNANKIQHGDYVTTGDIKSSFPVNVYRTLILNKKRIDFRYRNKSLSRSIKQVQPLIDDGTIRFYRLEEIECTALFEERE